MRAGRIAIALIVAAALLTGCTGTSNGTAPTIDPKVTVEKSIDYRTVDGENLQLDACLPVDSDGSLPSVALVHGGAFQEGDRSNLTGLCELFAEKGFAAFAIDYRLLPASYPAQTEDVAAAVDWLREPAQTERFGIDPDRIALLGSSAGAIIALSTAAALGAAGTPVPSVVGLSAAGDLTESALKAGTPDPALEQIVLAYLGCETVEGCDTALAASPMYNVDTLPPTLLVHGSEELIPVAQAEALYDAMQEAGIPSELDIQDGTHHGLQLLTPQARKAIIEFLDSNSSP